MTLGKYIVGGRKVPEPDIVAALTVSAFEGCEPFVEANRSRIHDDSSAAVVRRNERASTEEPRSFTIVLPFSNPPGQSRSYFVLGRDPKCCDVVCTSPAVSNQHIKIAIEGDHVVLYDVSSRGSDLALDGRGMQRTWPKPGAPYKCILPRGCIITLQLKNSLLFELKIPSLKDAQLDEFRKRRDVFFANCSDLGGLSIASQVPTENATPSHTALEKRQHMYWFEKKLGHGSFGTVYMVRRLEDWTVLAAKQIVESNPRSHYIFKSGLEPQAKKKGGSEAGRRGLKKEMELLQTLRHERIVGYADWYEDVPGRWILVMEYCQHGSLEEMIRDRKKPFKKSEIAEILKQTAEGLLYIHGRGITHRDLKPDNILLRSNSPFSLALADFGLSNKKGDGGSLMKTMCGTWAYMAPEMWGFGHYTKAVDIWALGVVGFALIKNGLPARPKDSPSYADFVFDEVQKMFDRDPRDRLVANVRKMLARDPDDRLPAAECIEDANELLDSLRSSQPAVPGSAPVPASIQYQDGQFRSRSSREPSSQTLRSSEMREIEEKFFQTSTFKAAAAAAAGAKAPVPNPTQKRGTDALPRSNSLEASLPKVPRTKLRDQIEQQGSEEGSGAPQRRSNSSGSAGQDPSAKKGTGVLPQPRPMSIRQTEQPPPVQKRATGHQLRAESPNSAPRNPSLTEKTAGRMPLIVEEKEQRPGQGGHTNAPPPKSNSAAPRRPGPVTGCKVTSAGDNATKK
ncbi:kinase-like domain-containing protein [Chaetomium sp. MPI-CAGE-AT-0009]|nr:kinase-like domain-containing protein [Chaetomium sp. MPI-CAGE-AT-0009]